MPRSLRSELIHLVAVSGLVFLSFGVVTPVLDELVRIPFATIPRATSRFMAVHGVASVIFAIVAGIFSDKIGRRLPVLLLSVVGSGVTSALIPLLDNFNLVLLVRFADGAFGASATVMLFARAIDLAGPRYRAQAMGFMALSVALGFIAAPTLVAGVSLWSGQGAGTVSPQGLVWIFALVGGLLLLAGVTISRRLGEQEIIEPTGQSFGRGLSLVRRQPRILLPAAFGFIDRYTFGTIAHLLGLMVVDRFALGARASAFYMLGFWLAFALACAVAVRLSKRCGVLSVIALGSFGYGLSLMVLGISNPIGFALALINAGVFCALQYIPTVSWLGTIAHARERGTAMAFFNTAGSIGIVCGLVISARLAEVSYALAFAVAGGLEILSAAAARLYAASHRPGGEPVENPA